MRSGFYAGKEGASLQSRRYAYLEANKEDLRKRKEEIAKEEKKQDYIPETDEDFEMIFNKEQPCPFVIREGEHSIVWDEKQYPRHTDMQLPSKEQVHMWRTVGEAIKPTKRDVSLLPILPMVVGWPPLLSLLIAAPHEEYTSVYRVAHDLLTLIALIESGNIRFKAGDVTRADIEKEKRVRARRKEHVTEFLAQELDKNPPTREAFTDLIRNYTYAWLDIQIAFIYQVLVRPYFPPNQLSLGQMLMRKGVYHLNVAVPATRELIVGDAQQFFQLKIMYVHAVVESRKKVGTESQDLQIPNHDVLVDTKLYTTTLANEPNYAGFISQSAIDAYFRWLMFEKDFLTPTQEEKKN